jgi:hypothetical protein
MYLPGTYKRNANLVFCGECGIALRLDTVNAPVATAVWAEHGLCLECDELELALMMAADGIGADVPALDSNMPADVLAELRTLEAAMAGATWEH